MFVIDMQVHVWGPADPDRPWDTIVPLHGTEPFQVQHLLKIMSEAGVDRAVLVPPLWVGYYNDYCLEAARRWPERFAVMGRLDLARPGAIGEVETWLNQSGMVGIRFMASLAPWRNWFDDGTFDLLWPRAERLGIPVAMHTYGLTDRVARVAARHPDLTIIIDHLGLPLGKHADPFGELSRVLALARYPNVCVKVSGLPHFVDEPYPFQALHSHIHRVLDSFGPERMMWGSDHTRMPCSYRESLGLFTEACDFLGEEDRSLILGRTAARVLRWPIQDDNSGDRRKGKK